MSNGNPVTEAQASAMLQRLESETGAREAELLEQARAAAGRLRRAAFAEARKKLAIGVAAE
jgi:hypothetical protein